MSKGEGALKTDGEGHLGEVVGERVELANADTRGADTIFLFKMSAIKIKILFI